MLYKSSSNTPSFQVLHQQIREGVGGQDIRPTSINTVIADWFWMKFQVRFVGQSSTGNTYQSDIQPMKNLYFFGPKNYEPKTFDLKNKWF